MGVQVNKIIKWKAWVPGKSFYEAQSCPIHTNKTCLIKPGLTKLKLVTES